MNKKIFLKPLFHRDRECIGIYFDHDPAINNVIRKHAGAKWSITKKTWWIPLDRENYNQLCRTVNKIAPVDNTALHEYLSQKKKMKMAVPVFPEKRSLASSNIKIQPAATLKNNAVIYKARKTGGINAHVLPRMEEQLKLKSYSQSTIKTYLGEMAQLLQLLKNIPAMICNRNISNVTSSIAMKS
jgi:integrase/recombinase XerD